MPLAHAASPDILSIPFILISYLLLYRRIVDLKSSVFVRAENCIDLIITKSYFHSAAHDMKALFAIWLAMKELERKTCIRFQKRKTENEYIWFYRGVG